MPDGGRRARVGRVGGAAGDSRNTAVRRFRAGEHIVRTRRFGRTGERILRIRFFLRRAGERGSPAGCIQFPRPRVPRVRARLRHRRQRHPLGRGVRRGHAARRARKGHHLAGGRRLFPGAHVPQLHRQRHRAAPARTPLQADEPAVQREQSHLARPLADARAGSAALPRQSPHRARRVGPAAPQRARVRRQPVHLARRVAQPRARVPSVPRRPAAHAHALGQRRARRPLVLVLARLRARPLAGAEPRNSRRRAQRPALPRPQRQRAPHRGDGGRQPPARGECRAEHPEPRPLRAARRRSADRRGGDELRPRAARRPHRRGVHLRRHRRAAVRHRPHRHLRRRHRHLPLHGRRGVVHRNAPLPREQRVARTAHDGRLDVRRARPRPARRRAVRPADLPLQRFPRRHVHLRRPHGRGHVVRQSHRRGRRGPRRARGRAGIPHPQGAARLHHPHRPLRRLRQHGRKYSTGNGLCVENSRAARGQRGNKVLRRALHPRRHRKLPHRGQP